MIPRDAKSTRALRVPTVVLALSAAACGGGGGPSVPQAPLIVSLSSNTSIVAQDGTPQTVNVTVTRPSGDNNSVTLSVTGLPAGVSAAVTSPGAGTTGSVTLTAQNARAGTYSVMVNASDGLTSGNTPLSLVIAIVATIANHAMRPLNLFMSTSFQPAEWDYLFFTNHPDAVTTLATLSSQHIRLQPVSKGTPQKADQTWDFTMLDSVLNSVISVGDKSPELQLAVAPAWMDDSNGHLEPSHFQDFANYCADVVKYYNTTSGFTDSSGLTHVHTPFTPITWWGIFNEPNINGLTPSEYTQLYNLVVPAMQAAGSQVPLKFVAVELADFSNEPQNFLPTFVSGVTAQVDAVATHFYSSCNQKDSDQQIFDTVPGFHSHVDFFYSELSTNPALMNVPVWVTENNVNADFDKGGGISACNGTPFVLDRRGTSAFFAAWRPYVFSQLAQAGAQSLYHWDFDADAQFGEVDYQTADPYLSYWVDDWLGKTFASPPAASILELSTTESSPATVEIFAVQPGDGSVVILLANHAVHASTDNNGSGDPRTVLVDLSQWGSFSKATVVTFDAFTSQNTGPQPVMVAPATRMAITLQGYGSALLTLK